MKNKHAAALGRIKSEAKANASRANGRLGGRPKKVMAEELDFYGVPKEVLVEMARIGDLDQYSFWVYTDSLKSPSFHLKHKTDFEIVLQMKDLKILEIKFNKSRFTFEKDELPPGPVLKIVKEFMSKKRPSGIDNFDFMIDVWGTLND